ncbi:MAG: HlyD family efflux transporter periplasmic adaptor subunit [Candidatus Marinimicrobia bacterium]|nr:HlyD family efflux transporter periplasmic adaptor subunit [Candidatus Neomarinimicrobiota bacterium]
MKKILIFLFLFFISCAKNDSRSDAYGNFEATEITISAQAQGELLNFDITEGVVVEKNQILGQIDTTVLHIKKQQVLDNIRLMTMKIHSAEFNLQAMRRQHELLGKEQNRILELFKNEATTEQNLDKITTEFDVTGLKIQALEAEILSITIQKQTLNNQLNEIKENLDKTRIMNPVKGTILTKYKETHELVSIGMPLYKIANLENMYLKIYISADQLDDIKIGQQVEVLVDKNLESTYQLFGNITWISATSEFTPKNIQTRKERIDQVYAVKVLVKNNGLIKIGMPGEVNF